MLNRNFKPDGSYRWAKITRYLLNIKLFLAIKVHISFDIFKVRVNMSLVNPSFFFLLEREILFNHVSRFKSDLTDGLAILILFNMFVLRILSFFNLIAERVVYSHLFVHFHTNVNSQQTQTKNNITSMLQLYYLLNLR